MYYAYLYPYTGSGWSPILSSSSQESEQFALLAIGCKSGITIWEYPIRYLSIYRSIYLSLLCLSSPAMNSPLIIEVGYICIKR